MLSPVGEGVATLESVGESEGVVCSSLAASTTGEGADVPPSFEGKPVTGVIGEDDCLSNIFLNTPISTSFPYHGKLLAALANPPAA